MKPPPSPSFFVVFFSSPTRSTVSRVYCNRQYTLFQPVSTVWPYPGRIAGFGQLIALYTLYLRIERKTKSFEDEKKKKSCQAPAQNSRMPTSSKETMERCRARRRNAVTTETRCFHIFRVHVCCAASAESKRRKQQKTF